MDTNFCFWRESVFGNQGDDLMGVVAKLVEVNVVKQRVSKGGQPAKPEGLVCPTCGQYIIVNVPNQYDDAGGQANGPARRDPLLSSLDEETLTALREGEIDDKVALRLAREPDVARRVEILNGARKLAAKRVADLVQRLAVKPRCSATPVRQHQS